MDSNQAVIINALVASECSVESLASHGAGCPDLLVGRDGRNYLLEVKNRETDWRGRAAEKGHPGPTAEAQSKWRRNWRGKPPVTVETVEEALRAVGLL